MATGSATTIPEIVSVKSGMELWNACISDTLGLHATISIPATGQQKYPRVGLSRGGVYSPPRPWDQFTFGRISLGSAPFLAGLHPARLPETLVCNLLGPTLPRPDLQRTSAFHLPYSGIVTVCGGILLCPV